MSWSSSDIPDIMIQVVDGKVKFSYPFFPLVWRLRPPLASISYRTGQVTPPDVNRRKKGGKLMTFKCINVVDVPGARHLRIGVEADVAWIAYCPLCANRSKTHLVFIWSCSTIRNESSTQHDSVTYWSMFLLGRLMINSSFDYKRKHHVVIECGPNIKDRKVELVAVLTILHGKLLAELGSWATVW